MAQTVVSCDGSCICLRKNLGKDQYFRANIYKHPNFAASIPPHVQGMSGFSHTSSFHHIHCSRSLFRPLVHLGCPAEAVIPSFIDQFFIQYFRIIIKTQILLKSVHIILCWVYKSVHSDQLIMSNLVQIPLKNETFQNSISRPLK